MPFSSESVDFTTPAIFVEGNYAEIALAENLLRQGLTAIEEAGAIQALLNPSEESNLA